MSSNCRIETTPIEIKFLNWGRARAQIVGLKIDFFDWGKARVEIVGFKCDLFFYSHESNTAPFW